MLFQALIAAAGKPDNVFALELNWLLIVQHAAKIGQVHTGVPFRIVLSAISICVVEGRWLSNIADKS